MPITTHAKMNQSHIQIQVFYFVTGHFKSSKKKAAN
jgi:hypothetical protein